MLTDKGFYRPTYDELLEAQEARAKQLLGDDIDTSNLSVLGKYIRINVDDFDKLWQTLEQVYYARFPNTSSGVSLERLCVFAGITRNPATYAEHKIIIIGTKGATIEGGFLVSTQGQEKTFYTVDDCTIGNDSYTDENGNTTEYGYVEVIVRAEESGSESNVAVGSIRYVVNPSADVYEIEHTKIETPAEDLESDHKLRKRFSDTIAGTGATTMEALKAAILRVENVKDVYIEENDTNEVDPVTGVLPHSFECYVLVENKEEAKQPVAEAILSKKAAGISPTGKVEVLVPDSTGVKHVIRFTWTEEKKVRIRVTVNTNHLFPVDGEDRIKQNITDLVLGLGNAETLYYTSLFGKIHIDGVESVTNLELSENGGAWVKTDIICEPHQVIRTDTIEVTVLEE
jgi:hypothetical protein